jgi:hypothetical protein
LVPRVDGSFRQVDEPRSGRADQCRGQKVGINPIVSSGGLYDRLIHLNEFFRIAGSHTGLSYQRSLRWSWCPCSDAPPIFNDITEVIPITAIFPYVAGLGDTVLCVVVSQVTIAAN